MGATTVATGSPQIPQGWPHTVPWHRAPTRSAALAPLSTGQGLCRPARAASSSPPGSEGSIPQPMGALRQRRNRQLWGRRHYSPKWPLQTAAGWSNSEQPQGPIQNWPRLSTITFPQTTGFRRMTKTRSSMTFHSALNSLGFTDFLIFFFKLFFLLKQPPKKLCQYLGEEGIYPGEGSI